MSDLMTLDPAGIPTDATEPVRPATLADLHARWLAPSDLCGIDDVREWTAGMLAAGWLFAPEDDPATVGNLIDGAFVPTFAPDAVPTMRRLMRRIWELVEDPYTLPAYHDDGDPCTDEAEAIALDCVVDHEHIGTDHALRIPVTSDGLDCHPGLDLVPCVDPGCIRWAHEGRIHVGRTGATFYAAGL